ncbi:MAG: hypothetical protein K2Q12_07995 [Rickettsiales bacterium]|nr:hypothetical protein [Rickettsiales bacterium]
MYDQTNISENDHASDIYFIRRLYQAIIVQALRDLCAKPKKADPAIPTEGGGQMLLSFVEPIKIDMEDCDDVDPAGEAHAYIFGQFEDSIFEHDCEAAGLCHVVVRRSAEGIKQGKTKLSVQVMRRFIIKR